MTRLLETAAAPGSLQLLGYKLARGTLKPGRSISLVLFREDCSQTTVLSAVGLRPAGHTGTGLAARHPSRFIAR
jgi:hypothetical protein